MNEQQIIDRIST